ncbi:MAG: fibronectin type III domain-containing protein, partial [Spirochaetes bacterium]|nr:fibronectin type III domain-containing protein [Spirochaetota bacterium]
MTTMYSFFRNGTIGVGLILPLLLCACNKLDELEETFRSPANGGVSPDTTPPSFITGISFSTVGTNSLTVNWGIAADNRDAQATLQYKLVKDDSAAANINSITLADARTGGDLLMDWTANTTTKVVTSLTGGATYFFAVIVKDAVGNMSLYSPQSQTIIAPATFDASFTAATDMDDFGVNADM